MNWIRLNRAMQIAATRHHPHTYKYNDSQPQISHLNFVDNVLQYYHFDEDTIIAGILHDTVEDTDLTLQEIKKEFGTNVSRIVAEVTFDQNSPWEERQFTMQHRMKTASPAARAVKCADIFHHLVLFHDQSQLDNNTIYKQYSPEKVIWKYDSLIRSIGTGWGHPILEKIKELLAEYKSKQSFDGGGVKQ